MIALSFELEKKPQRNSKYRQTYYQFPSEISDTDIVLSQRYQTATGNMSFRFFLCENWQEAKEHIATGACWYEDFRNIVRKLVINLLVLALSFWFLFKFKT